MLGCSFLWNNFMRLMSQSKKPLTIASKLVIGIFAVFILLVVVAIAADDEPKSSSSANKEETVADKAEAKKKKIESQFSAWDGSHRNLEKLIKENLNDPGSYEHLETNYWDMDTAIVVRTEYTAKNAYGGRVRGAVKARYDLEGNLIEVIDSQ